MAQTSSGLLAWVWLGTGGKLCWYGDSDSGYLHRFDCICDRKFNYISRVGSGHFSGSLQWCHQTLLGLLHDDKGIAIALLWISLLLTVCTGGKYLAPEWKWGLFMLILIVDLLLLGGESGKLIWSFDLNAAYLIQVYHQSTRKAEMERQDI